MAIYFIAYGHNHVIRLKSEHTHTNYLLCAPFNINSSNSLSVINNIDTLRMFRVQNTRIIFFSCFHSLRFFFWSNLLFFLSVEFMHLFRSNQFKSKKKKKWKLLKNFWSPVNCHKIQTNNFDFNRMIVGILINGSFFIATLSQFLFYFRFTYLQSFFFFI